MCYNKTVERETTEREETKMKTYTYWKNLRNGAIYKYEFGTKPLNADTEWKQVTGWDYDEALRIACERYLNK